MKDIPGRQNVILLHFYGFGSLSRMKASSQHVGLRLILAALLSLTLLSSGVLSAHVHDDGLPHYSDCDHCLQLSGLDASPTASAGLPARTSSHSAHASTPTVSPVNHARHFSARAPPHNLPQPHNP